MLLLLLLLLLPWCLLLLLFLLLLLLKLSLCHLRLLLFSLLLKFFPVGAASGFTVVDVVVVSVGAFSVQLIWLTHVVIPITVIPHSARTSANRSSKRHLLIDFSGN